jgi:RNA polymerase sigma-70 factor (ECF subfamily)
MDERDEQLYREHGRELIRFATSLVGASQAEDVVARAVVRAMTARAWPTVSEPRAYLFRSVLNEAHTVARAERRRSLREVRTARQERSDTGSVALEVRDAMARLTLRERSVLYLAYWLDFSVEEIAATLRISQRSAERALHSARHELEETLS